MIYLVASVIIIVINVVPAFMPATWTVVSYIYIKYEVALVFLALVGAVSSSLGRFLLAKISYKMTLPIFSIGTISNLAFIGQKIRGNPFKVFVFTFIWAISPVASNPLFIAVGMAGTKLKAVISGFFVGRSLSYFFLALTSKIIVDNFKEIFIGGFSNWTKILINIFGFVLIFIYLVIDWEKLLTEKKLKLCFPITKNTHVKKR